MTGLLPRSALLLRSASGFRRGPTLSTQMAASSYSTTADRLQGKVAVVSASTEGIGYAIARRLAQDGAKVVISSRSQTNVDNAVTQLRRENLDVTGVVCHVGKDEDRKRLVQQAVEAYGGIDIFVSNAAVSPVYGPVLKTTNDKIWNKVFDTNLKSTFFLCQEVIPEIEKRRGGAIVINSSITGFSPMEGIGLYSISKTALLGMVKALAPECALKNIRINSISPGIINTKLSKVFVEDKETNERIEAATLLKRIGTPEECASVVSFLVSDDASYMTAENVVVAGGMQSRL